MIKKQAFIEWNTRLTHGVELIDDQHKILVHHTNTLYLACLESNDSAKNCFIEIAREMVNYVHYHFSTEEHMMRLLMYPNYHNHRKEHEKFIREILRQTQMFAEQKKLVPYHYVMFLKDWIYSHIAVRDKTLAEYILNMEDSEKLQILLSRPGSYV